MPLRNAESSACAGWTASLNSAESAGRAATMVSGSTAAGQATAQSDEQLSLQQPMSG